MTYELLPSAADGTHKARDLFTVATYLVPTEAHIVRSCLEAAGVPALIADHNLIQVYSLLSPAVGGVRVLVPQSYLDQAHAVIDAFERGEYELGDDFDVGEV